MPGGDVSTFVEKDRCFAEALADDRINPDVLLGPGMTLEDAAEPYVGLWIAQVKAGLCPERQRQSTGKWSDMPVVGEIDRRDGSERMMFSKPADGSCSGVSSLRP